LLNSFGRRTTSRKDFSLANLPAGSRKALLAKEVIRLGSHPFLMNSSLRAFIDLTRLHFFFAWPVLFASGYLLATTIYGGFSWPALFQVALIGFFGFEAGFILNDYIDREYDQRDVDTCRLTRYWRVFGTRPLPAGLISPEKTLRLFVLFVAITTLLIVTLPYPHSVYVLLIMLFCYSMEVFYQLKKRHETYPVGQLLGRTDFALFPVAGYLCTGYPDTTSLMYFLFFYPFAIAHLGVNDLIDVANDRARGMKTISTLYGLRGTVAWVGGFTLLHAFMALIFISNLGLIGRAGILIGLFLLAMANAIIITKKTPDAGLKGLPFFHIAMLVYAGSIALDALV
jgi:4-hydroxybenzoate polyprenyltransferase